MRLSAPKQITWLVALILGVIALLSFLGVIPQLSAYTFWMMTIAWAILILATLLDGL
jgi:hypothetical protein